MSSEGPYGRQGFQSNPAGYGGGDYTQQPQYGYGGGGYGAPPPIPPQAGVYGAEYNPYGDSSYEVCRVQREREKEEQTKPESHGSL
jgi:hypothetical protein